MKPDREDNECRTAEPPSFARVRAELLAVVITNHPEFTLEEAEKMLQEARLLSRRGKPRRVFLGRPSAKSHSHRW
jgi:hypothetical protein